MARTGAEGELGTSGRRGGNRYKGHLLLRLDDNDWSGSRKKGRQWYPSGKRQKQEASLK